MNYIVTYRSNIFIQFGSDTNTVQDLSYDKHCYIFCVPLLQLQWGDIINAECTL